MSKRRVVISGLGILSPLGNDLATSWQGIVDGRSGIGPITNFDASAFATRIAGEVKGFAPEDYMPKKKIREMGRFAQLSIAASIHCMKDSGIELTEEDRDACGSVRAAVCSPTILTPSTCRPTCKVGA